MIRKVLFKKLIALTFIAALTACAATPVGKPINYVKLETLTLGYSTQDRAKEVMGYPQRVLYEGERTIYQYRYYNGDSSDPIRQAVDLVFNKQQRLIDVTINDALLINKDEVVHNM